MSDVELTKEELFKEAEELYIDGDYIGGVSGNRKGVYMDGLYLNIEQARELRDWLNKVLS
jgi:hypothetical protein